MAVYTVVKTIDGVQHTLAYPMKDVEMRMRNPEGGMRRWKTTFDTEVIINPAHVISIHEAHDIHSDD